MDVVAAVYSNLACTCYCCAPPHSAALTSSTGKLPLLPVSCNAPYTCLPRSPQPFAKLPVPQWQLGKPVELAAVTSVADSYLKALEPARKLRTPALPAQVSDQLAQLGRSMGRDGADLKVRGVRGGCAEAACWVRRCYACLALARLQEHQRGVRAQQWLAGAICCAASLGAKCISASMPVATAVPCSSFSTPCVLQPLYLLLRPGHAGEGCL